MVDRSVFPLGVRPLLRLVIIFAIVGFYHPLVGAWLSDMTQLATVITLSFITWVLIAKFIFEPFVNTLNL